VVRLALADIAEWLREPGLEQYVLAFAENEIDWDRN
jgi:SAM domain (Sterile alpha motif)